MKAEFTTADTEDTELGQRKSYNSLWVLCALCVCGGESQYDMHSSLN
jgi:hypothetical protein